MSADAWRVANETQAASMHANADAIARDETARIAEAEAARTRRLGAVLAVFGRTDAQEQQEAALAAREARVMADKARRQADALAGVARHARLRADKAQAALVRLRQGADAQGKLHDAKTGLVEVDNRLVTAEKLHKEAEKLVETMVKNTQQKWLEVDAAQRAMDATQDRLSAGGSPELWTEYKQMSKEVMTAYAEFTDSTDKLKAAQKTESELAVEVAVLRTQVIESQHTLAVIDRAITHALELEKEIHAELSGSHEHIRVESELIDLYVLNASHALERAMLEGRIANMSSEVTLLKKMLDDSVDSTVTEERARLVSTLKGELDELRRKSDEISRQHEKEKLEQAEKFERDRKLIEDKLSHGQKLQDDYLRVLREKEILEQRLSHENRTNVTKCLEEIQMLNNSLQFHKTLEQQWEKRAEEQEGIPQRLNETVQQCIYIPWAEANNSADALDSALVAAHEAEAAATKAEEEASGAQPSFLMHVFASDDTIRKGAKLGSVAMQLRKKADEAEILVKALRKIKDDHHQSVQTLKRQLDDALQAEMTVPWKAANDSTEAFNMALKSAEDAQKAAVKAEQDANAAEPFLLFRNFASSAVIERAAQLRSVAEELGKKAEAASSTVEVLQRLHTGHYTKYMNLTQELLQARQQIELFEQKFQNYHALLPPAWIDPRRMFTCFGLTVYSFMINIWASSVFTFLFFGMFSIYLLQLCSTPKFAERLMRFLGFYSYVLIGLYAVFWLGMHGWSWGWMFTFFWAVSSSLRVKRTQRIKTASTMGYRLPVLESHDRNDPGFELEIRIISAILEAGKDLSGKSDPYVVVNCDGEKKKTKTILQTLHPHWDEKVSFVDIQEPGVEVSFTVYDMDRIMKDDMIGKKTMKLSDILVISRENVESEIIEYNLVQHESGMAHGSIKVTFKWRNVANIDFEGLVERSNARPFSSRNFSKSGLLGHAFSPSKHIFDHTWGVSTEMEEMYIFFETYMPGATVLFAELYARLLSCNIDPTDIHVFFFCFLAFLFGRLGFDVGYVLLLTTGLCKAETAISAVSCRRAWEKRPSLSTDVRTRALDSWQKAYIPKEHWLNESQLWAMFQTIREGSSYWLREKETTWINNLLGTFWSNYNRWISSFLAHLIQSFVSEYGVSVEQCTAGTGYPKLKNTAGALVDPARIPRPKSSKMTVTIVAASGLKQPCKGLKVFLVEKEASNHEKGASSMSKTSVHTKVNKHASLSPYWSEKLDFNLRKDAHGEKLRIEIMSDKNHFPLQKESCEAFLEIDTEKVWQEWKDKNDPAKVRKELDSQDKVRSAQLMELGAAIKRKNSLLLKQKKLEQEARDASVLFASVPKIGPFLLKAVPKELKEKAEMLRMKAQQAREEAQQAAKVVDSLEKANSDRDVRTRTKPKTELHKFYVVAPLSKQVGVKIELKFDFDDAIPNIPKPGSSRVFQLESDLVWDANFLIKVRKLIQIQVQILQLKMPLRVTMEWANYEDQMRKLPSMQSCGNDFEEFQRQWNEWKDHPDFPKPVRVWLDLRSRPTIDTKIKSSGVGDVLQFPFIQQLVDLPKIVHDLFPIAIPLGEAGPVSTHPPTTHVSTQFVDFMDVTKSCGKARCAMLKIDGVRATTDASTPIMESNYYFLVRYGRMKTLDSPPEHSKILDERKERLRVSQTSWMTHTPAYYDSFLFPVEVPAQEMISFEMYMINSRTGDFKHNVGEDLLVMKRTFKLTEFIDQYRIVIYPRLDRCFGEDPNKKSLRRMITIQNEDAPVPYSLTIKVQLFTSGDTLDSLVPTKFDQFSDPYFNWSSTQTPSIAKETAFKWNRKAVIRQTRSFAGSNIQELLADSSGCPGVLSVQLSSPSAKQGLIDNVLEALPCRTFVITLFRNSQVESRAEFHETSDNELVFNHDKLPPVFRFEIPSSCCQYTLQVSDGKQTKSMQINDMTLDRDGVFEMADSNISSSQIEPINATFPAILASFRPHTPRDIPMVVMTIHRVEALPWYTGLMPPDAYCCVTVRRERRLETTKSGTFALSDKGRSVSGFSKDSSWNDSVQATRSYTDYRRAMRTSLPIYDGGDQQENPGFETSRSRGTTAWNFGDKFELKFGADMLQTYHDFEQVVHVDVFQEHEDQTVLVGTWRRSIREMFLEFLEQKLSMISDDEIQEELQQFRIVNGSTPRKAFSLNRDQAPWTSIEMEFEFLGLSMLCCVN